MEKQPQRSKKHVRKNKMKQGLTLIMDNLVRNPQCPHGPTLLFEYKARSKQGVQKFYTCSACRDPKNGCFYLEFGKSLSKAALKSIQQRKEKLCPAVSFETLHQEWTAMTAENSQLESIYFCHSCSRFVNPNMVNVEHKGHHVEKNISDHQLTHPTELLCPLQNTSQEAQFFFSANAINFIKTALNGLQCSKLISIGTPSLLENFKGDASFDVMLLDFDWRYSTFFGPNFCWYNMFNHHFMDTGNDPQGQKGRDRFSKFLNGFSGQGSYVIVMDPPFGGRVEALANTIKEIAAEIRQLGRTENVYYLWIYPYFMESYIKAELPGTRMMDYKINYTNHPDYKIGSRLSNKKGSPVRVFTNAPLKLIPMPEAEGYKFCDICQHHVSVENQHCFKCNACTSKNGTTYVHCDICERCVKPTWKHCKLCNRCCNMHP